MSTNPFGTPTGSASSATTTSTTTTQVNGGLTAEQSAQFNQPGAGAGQSADFIDPNDPRLLSEDTSVNVGGDAYAQPTPPPDGKYRARIKDEGIKQDNGQTVKDVAKLTGKNKSIAITTSIKATLITPERPEFDGLEIFDPWVSTFVQRDGSTKVLTILGRIKQPSGQPWVETVANTAPGAVVRYGSHPSHRVQMDLFHKALAGEPEVVIETAWEASCETCRDLAEKRGEKRPRGIQGMTAFPPETDPVKRRAGYTHNPNITCPQGHGTMRARPRIVQVLALGK